MSHETKKVLTHWNDGTKNLLEPLRDNGTKNCGTMGQKLVWSTVGLLPLQVVVGHELGLVLTDNFKYYLALYPSILLSIINNSTILYLFMNKTEIF